MIHLFLLVPLPLVLTVLQWYVLYSVLIYVPSRVSPIPEPFKIFSIDITIQAVAASYEWQEVK